MLNRVRSEEEGFTLIELLVVILIIGILAAIALPAFLNQRQKGQEADSKSAVRNAVSLVESAAVDSGGTYPATAPNFTSEGISGITYNQTGGGSGFTVSATSANGCVFLYTKASGVGTRSKSGTCSSSGSGW